MKVKARRFAAPVGPEILLMIDGDCTMLIFMRRFFIGLLMCASIGWAVGQSKIQQVDFKNFSYPWRHYSGWPHQLEWLDSSGQENIQLVSGRWTEEQEADGPFSGLTLEKVQFADVTSDGQTDAIVTLRYDTGGTQFSHYVYVYSLAEHKPKLLASFHSGDRAASGLYEVYGQKGNLIVELFDPQKGEGDFARRDLFVHDTDGVTEGL